MKTTTAILTVCGLSLAATGFAAEPLGGNEVIRRGDAVLTLDDLDARMQRFSDTERSIYARDSSNMAGLMDRLLLNRQLSAEARELGVDRDPKVARDMQLAVEEVLATHRLNQLLKAENLPDFAPLARERFLAEPGKYGTPETRRVVHILIDSKSRSEAEALALTRQIRTQALGDTSDFADLVLQHSDDPSKSENQGIFELQHSGVFVPEFERAARALARPGDISEPVKTQFGYHLIKLLDVKAGTQPRFEEVQTQIVDELREAYVGEARGNYSAKLQGLPDSGNEALLLTLPARYGGRPEEAAGMVPPPVGEDGQ